jgi:FlaA1/EpsC-like NDP-sugar epimerase
MLLPKSNTPRWIVVVIDLFLSLVALFFAYVIRFDLKAEAEVIKEEWEILSKSILVYVGVKFFVFYLFKIHKGLVRHTSTEDLRRIFFASITSSLLFFILGLIRFHFIDEYYLFPTSVLLIEFLASFMLLLGLRFSIKLLYLESMKVKKSEERVLIYGAGISGLITKRTIEKDLASKEKIVGFLDDNKKLAGNRL